MPFHLIGVLFHLKLSTKKEGDCFGALRERGIWEAYIRLLSLPFFNVIWFPPKNFTVLKNRSINFCKSLKVSRLIINVRLLQVSRTLKTRKVIKRGFKSQKLSDRFCVYKWASLTIHWHSFQISYARAQQAPLRDFWKKLLVPRNTKASKKRNGVIMLPR